MGVCDGTGSIDTDCTPVNGLRWGQPQRGTPRVRTARPPSPAEALDIQTLVVPGRPWGLNFERSTHWTKHRDKTNMIRETAGWLATNLTAMGYVDIVVECRMRLPLLDTGSNFPTVKAIVDGLVDVGVLQDDTSRYVRSIQLLAPVAIPKAEAETTTLTLLECKRG